MSNIYDDAIIMIHHRRHLNGGIHSAYDDEIEKTLERAKKEHELLVLYKERDNIEIYYWEQFTKQIKQLEASLNE